MEHIMKACLRGKLEAVGAVVDDDADAVRPEEVWAELALGDSTQ